MARQTTGQTVRKTVAAIAEENLMHRATEQAARKNRRWGQPLETLCGLYLVNDGEPTYNIPCPHCEYEAALLGFTPIY